VVFALIMRDTLLIAQQTSSNINMRSIDRMLIDHKHIWMRVAVKTRETPRTLIPFAANIIIVRYRMRRVAHREGIDNDGYQAAEQIFMNLLTVLVTDPFHGMPSHPNSEFRQITRLWHCQIPSYLPYLKAPDRYDELWAPQVVRILQSEICQYDDAYLLPWFPADYFWTTKDPMHWLWHALSTTSTRFSAAIDVFLERRYRDVDLRHLTSELDKTYHVYTSAAELITRMTPYITRRDDYLHAFAVLLLSTPETHLILPALLFEIVHSYCW
jgi:hypothetical protein